MFKIINTKPYKDQIPGTSGLRKKVSVFMQENYLENFIQSIFNSIDCKGATLVLGGDGRYYNNVAIQKILKIAAANGCAKIILAKDGLLSTPAASYLIRLYKADGGIILSASHNPGGINHDFGVKYNIYTGSAAPSSFTSKVYEQSLNITKYKIVDSKDIDLSVIGHQNLCGMDIEIIDPVKDYADYMEQIFEFDIIADAIKSWLRFKFNAMNAITGPYAIEIFHNRLGVPKEYLENTTPLEDFGGIHPDPLPENLPDMFQEFLSPNADFVLGAACDGDGDRNLIIGKGHFVTPSDSLAILLSYIDYLPYYAGKCYGVARSLPTGRAVDAVAKCKGIPLYETPTGWKYFGNLLDSKKITLCGEESFGAGSLHAREKDGIWAVLFWLNIIARTKKSIGDILQDHWREYGRCYFARYDFEGLPENKAKLFIDNLRNNISHLQSKNENIAKAEEFNYTDPVDNSYSKGQGIIITLKTGARIVYRLSGTGTSGATLRVYIDHITEDYNLAKDTVVDPIYKIALDVSELKFILQREQADNIV